MLVTYNKALLWPPSLKWPPDHFQSSWVSRIGPPPSLVHTAANRDPSKTPTASAIPGKHSQHLQEHLAPSPNSAPHELCLGYLLVHNKALRDSAAEDNRRLLLVSLQCEQSSVGRRVLGTYECPPFSSVTSPSFSPSPTTLLLSTSALPLPLSFPFLFCSPLSLPPDLSLCHTPSSLCPQLSLFVVLQPLSSHSLPGWRISTGRGAHTSRVSASASLRELLPQTFLCRQHQKRFWKQAVGVGSCSWIAHTSKRNSDSIAVGQRDCRNASRWPSPPSSSPLWAFYTF